MSKMSKQAMMALVLTLGAVGCTNPAQFQSAETLRQGEFRAGGGVTYTQYEVENTDIDNDGENTTISVPAAHAYARYGITDEFEVHAAAWFPLGVSAGVKAQLVGVGDESGFDLSLGGDLGWVSLGASDDSGNSASVHWIDVHVPVYLGYRFSPGFALYLTPKYIMRSVVANEASFSHLTGGTLGMEIGSGGHFMLEGSVFVDVESGVPMLNFGIAGGM